MRTLLKRSDLLRQKNLNRKEIEILEKWQREINKVLELHHKKEGKTLTG
jgi:hypothetical protein